MKTLEELGVSPTQWKVCELFPAVDSINAKICDLSDNENVSANARLIAAAPNLYEALFFLLDRFKVKCNCDKEHFVIIDQWTIQNAERAMKKAGGAE